MYGSSKKTEKDSVLKNGKLFRMKKFPVLLMFCVLSGYFVDRVDDMLNR